MGQMFDSLKGRENPQMKNPMEMMGQLKADPLGFIRRMGYTVPEGTGSDPQSIVSALMRSGQVSQGRYAQALKMMQSR